MQSSKPRVRTARKKPEKTFAPKSPLRSPTARGRTFTVFIISSILLTRNAAAQKPKTDGPKSESPLGGAGSVSPVTEDKDDASAENPDHESSDSYDYKRDHKEMLDDERAWRKSKRVTQKRDEMKLRAETERAILEYEVAKRQRLSVERHRQMNESQKSDSANNESAAEQNPFAKKRVFFSNILGVSSGLNGFAVGAGPFTFHYDSTRETRATGASFSPRIDIRLSGNTTIGVDSLFSVGSWASEYSSSSESSSSGVQVTLKPKIGYILPISKDVALWPQGALILSFLSQEGDSRSSFVHEGTPGVSLFRHSSETFGLGASASLGIIFNVSPSLYLSFRPEVTVLASFGDENGSANGVSTSNPANRFSVSGAASGGLGLAF